MAEHDCITHEGGHPATVQDFDDALSEANIIADIVGKLADGQIGGAGVVCCPSLYGWLADQLSARLERIEVGGMTLRGSKCVKASTHEEA